MNTKTIVIAGILIVYGLLKILLGVLAFALPKETKQKWSKHPILGILVSEDETIAGKVVELIIMIFGIFTLIHGINLVSPVHDFIHNMLFSPISVYVLHSIFGTFLVLFYFAVVFTEIKIDKDMKYRNSYITKGLCSGLVFLITIPIVLLYRLHVEHGFKNIARIKPQHFVISILFTVMISLTLLYFVDEVFDIERKGFNVLYDVTSLIAIPLDISV